MIWRPTRPLNEVCYLLWHCRLPTRAELGEPMLRLMRSLTLGNAMDALQTRWFEISQRIETVMKAEKQIDANVDFYSASTYYLLGIPIDLFTPIFAASRVSGWTAHILEQYVTNRLIRPRGEYIGPPYPQTFVALDRRSY